MDNANINGDDALEDADDSGDTSKVGDQFMLAEFQNMRYFHQEETAINERRVDILLAVASGAAIGIVYLSQIGIEPGLLLALTAVGCLGLLVIGLPVFIDTLKRDITAVNYIHAINSIRAYFIWRAKHIKPYLLMPDQPFYPRYGELSSSRRASAAINSAATGALFAALRMLEYGERNPDILTIAVAVGVMVVIFLAHIALWRWVYWRAERQTRETYSTSLNEADEFQAQLQRRGRQARR